MAATTAFGANALAESGGPDLPAIEREIQSAHNYRCNGKHGRGNVWIDQLVQAMEQKPTSFRLDSGVALEPVFENS